MNLGCYVNWALCWISMIENGISEKCIVKFSKVELKKYITVWTLIPGHIWRDKRTDMTTIHGYLLFLLRKERLNGPNKTMSLSLLNLLQRG
jgi:hypothetical protein